MAASKISGPTAVCTPGCWSSWICFSMSFLIFKLGPLSWQLVCFCKKTINFIFFSSSALISYTFTTGDLLPAYLSPACWPRPSVLSGRKNDAEQHRQNNVCPRLTRHSRTTQRTSRSLTTLQLELPKEMKPKGAWQLLLHLALTVAMSCRIHFLWITCSASCFVCTSWVGLHALLTPTAVVLRRPRSCALVRQET